MISEEQYERYRKMREVNDAREIGRLCEQLADANAKIAELEQSATTLRQLEELLTLPEPGTPDGSSFVLFRQYRDGKITLTHRDRRLAPQKELSTAIAAAYAAKGE